MNKIKRDEVKKLLCQVCFKTAFVVHLEKNIRLCFTHLLEEEQEDEELLREIL